MVCIYCGGNTRVVNSRSSKRNPNIWRRRQCDSCKEIFTTNELPDLSRSVSIINHQDALETFSTDRLYMSVFKALSHREDALNDARHITNTITTKLLQEHSDGAIKIVDLKMICLNTLENFDKVAGTYYSAYHPTRAN